MADVFISYKRHERSAIDQIAKSLRERGLSVWFDASMSAGESFNDEIDREARAARAILVCWSPAALGSRWVKAEAMIGFEQDKLVACYVAGPDAFSPPTPFNTLHAEDLRAWLLSPNEEHPGWRSILRRVGRLCGRNDLDVGNVSTVRPNQDPRAQLGAERRLFAVSWRSPRIKWLVASAATILVVAMLVLLGSSLGNRAPDLNAYAPEYELNFMRACQAGGSGVPVCACIWDKIEAEIPVSAFLAFEALPASERAAHPLTAQLRTMTNACTLAPAPAVEGTVP